jgi:hypothetical protein
VNHPATAADQTSAEAHFARNPPPTGFPDSRSLTLRLGCNAGEGDPVDGLARRTDPETSHEAAAMAISFISRHQSLVLQALAEMGQAGAEQIGEQIGMPAYAVRKRTSELERLGLIADTGITRKTSSGRSERVWGVC